MPDLWRLKTGKIERLEYDGDGKIVRTRHKAPFEFVPTKGELKLNKFRMVLVGTVMESDVRVKNAELNENIDAKQFVRSDTPVTAETAEDISRLSAILAVHLAESAPTIEVLDMYLMQESAKKLSRKKVLKAIEARRAELSPEIPTEE